MVPLPKKDAKSLPGAESLNLQPFIVDNLFKFFAQGVNLTPFFGNGTKVNILSEVKPPLTFNIHFKTSVAQRPIIDFSGKSLSII